MKTRRKTITITLTVIILTSLLAFTVHAFYSEYLRQKFNMNVSIDLMFDMLSTENGENSPLAKYQSTIEGNGGYNPDAEWGTEQNPYIISDIKYLENLSTLQNYGYFKEIFFKDNNDIPYFLVSTSEYSAVCIDGKGTNIDPIGNDQYPFIGVIKGVTAENGNTITVGNYSSDTSALYNINVSSDKNAHDYGLFGSISHTGTVPSDDSETFSGVPSAVTDLLLADIKVSANHSILSDLTSWLSGHSFIFNENSTYTDSEGNLKNVVRDTHHIGILSGHANYAIIKNISIFYSSNDACALEVTGNAVGSLSNYYSSTGIIGLMDNINPVYENGIITVNSGTSDSELSYSLVAGGGKLSGNKAGYVNATDIFENYKYDSNGNVFTTDAHNILNSFNKDKESLTQEVTMSNGFTSTRNKYDYFYDGVFTFSLSNSPSEDTIKNIWNEENNELAAPDITYSSDSDSAWTYGQINSSSYVATLTPLSSLSAVSSSDNYVICYEDANGNLHLLNSTAPATSLSTEYKNADGLYKINCKTNKEFLQDYLVKIKSSGSFYNITGSNATNKLFGINSSSFGDTAEFELYFDTNAATGTGNISSGWFSDAPLRYTNNWTITKENNGYVFSMNAAYNRSRSTGFFNYTYQGGTVTKYLSYSGDNFVIADSKPNTSSNRILICKADIQWTNFEQDDPSAPHGYIPANPDNSGVLSNTSNYVFYANEEYHYSSGASSNPTLSNNSYTTSNSVNNNYGLPSNVAANQTLTYNLQSMESLGWKASDGSTALSSLNKKFALKDGIDIGVSASFFGIKYYSKGIISAPIGTDGTKTDMPTGTIAFKINKVPEGGAKINVIVAANTDQTIDSTSFGLWKATANTGFFLTTTSFNKDQPLSSFAIPNTKSLSNGEIDEYYKVYVDGNQKRTYLNGDVVLVAHTFTVYEEGVYIMGSTNGPMNICYFSADGVASSGLNQLGDIDYVYSNSNNKIISIENADTREDKTAEDYQNYYYPSMALLYTAQTTYPSAYINNEKVYIRRRIADNTRYLDVQIQSDTTNKYMDVALYSWYSDTGEIVHTP